MTFLPLLLLAASPSPAAATGMAQGIQLPASTTALPLEQNLTIQVSLQQLSVNGRKVLALQHGMVPAQAKAGGKVDSFLIRAVHRALEREVNNQSGVPGRVNIVADRRISYRTLMEVLYTAGQAKLGEYRLVVLGENRTPGVLGVSPPRLESAAETGSESAPRLLLTVAIGRQGFYVAGARGVLAAADTSGQASRTPTVPLKDGEYDYTGLTVQLARIKERFPAETRVIVSANPDVLHGTLIQTIDACREQLVTKVDGATERRPLFFDVSLTLLE